jgi:hypothetical protein
VNNNDMGKQLDALKRQIGAVVADMHARKLAIPAGALLAAIVLAVVLLPKSSTPPTAPPVAAAPPVTKTTPVAQISLISNTSIDEDTPLTSSSDPFIGKGNYACKKIGSNPDIYECQVADLKLRVVCSGDASGDPCDGGKGDGASGAAGATGGGGESGGSTGATGGGTGGSGKKKSKPKSSAYYVVDVSIDGTTKKDVVAGDTLPKISAPLAVYAGTNDAHTKGIFIAADGVVVTGVVVDATFGSFSLKKGQTATLTDATGAAHKLTLKSIDKVTK